jgi:hypothetical protein
VHLVLEEVAELLERDESFSPQAPAPGGEFSKAGAGPPTSVNSIESSGSIGGGCSAARGGGADDGPRSNSSNSTTIPAAPATGGVGATSGGASSQTEAAGAGAASPLSARTRRASADRPASS